MLKFLVYCTLTSILQFLGDRMTPGILMLLNLASIDSKKGKQLQINVPTNEKYPWMKELKS